MVSIYLCKGGSGSFLHVIGEKADGDGPRCFSGLCRSVAGGLYDGRKREKTLKKD